MSIKIISINIQGARLIESFLKFIEIENPDVILMQEVFISDNSNDPEYNILNTLQMFGFTYAYHAATYDTKRSSTVVKAGNAIASKYPLASLSTLRVDNGDRDRDRGAMSKTGNFGTGTAKSYVEEYNKILFELVENTHSFPQGRRIKLWL